ncbi:MAG: cell envelope integrity protein TolA [Proteobacteria bacterium]|nr:cell envelope integrity protein TolA [Pseudomonadota bacterium]MBU1649502.1 cell envelope integrity protein TolA [Pseudomonadota bacterium]
MPANQAFIHDRPNEWKLPINLAIGLHLLALFCAMVLPGLLDQRTILPEITTIDLVNMGEPAAPSKPATPTAAKQETKKAIPPPPPKPAEILKPEITKQIPLPPEMPDAVPIPEPTATPEPVAPPAPVEAISIKPLKQKLKKIIKDIPDTRPEDAKIRKDELKSITKKLQEEAKKETAAQETIRRQRQLAAAREEARRAELEARMAAADAKNALRDQIRASTSASPSQTSSQTGANAQSMGILEQQYYATIMGHIQQYWLPPDVKTWDPNILAIVSITIASDGQIVSQSFEQGSGDNLFDQFVLKTLEAANPLPAPPPALQKQRIEIGLRFKPSGIQ